MRTAGFVVTLLLLAGLGAAASPCSADDKEPTKSEAPRPREHDRSLLRFAQEPTGEHCRVAVAAARALVARLPNEDLSRVFAESYLHQAKIEGDNGEFAECMEEAWKASDEARHPHHVLPPGKSLKFLQANEYPVSR
jgi:hypothetical protein